MPVSYKNKDIIADYAGQIRGKRIGEKDEELLVPVIASSTGFGKSDKDAVEMHVYDSAENYLFSDYDIKGWSLLTSLQPIPTTDGPAPQKTSIRKIKLDIRKNLIDVGVKAGRYTVAYNLFRNIFGNSGGGKAYVSEISPSRKEIRILPISEKNEEQNASFEALGNVSNVSIDGTAKTYLLNFGKNNVIAAINWQLDKITVPDYPHSIIIKLYEKLPVSISIKHQLWLVEEIADPIIDKIVIEPPLEPKAKTNIRGPNYNLRGKFSGDPGETGLESWDDLLSTNAATSQQLINKLISGSLDGAEINVDYRAFDNFIHFSSAEERLKNFKYKLQLVEQYDSEIKALGSTGGAATSSYSAISSSQSFELKKRQVINGFDGFETQLYETSGSEVTSSLGFFMDASWPKQNSVATGSDGFTVYSISSSEGTAWYNKMEASASLYDQNNVNALRYNLPQHIIIDTYNADFVLFVDMIGQHFDVMWTYVNALSRISSRREKLGYGVPRDIVKHVLESFGWKTDSGWSKVKLWDAVLGTDVSGSYQQTGSRQSMTKSDYQKEVWTRIVQNVPYLLKTKGTARSIKALLSCYGVPLSILRIREYGGPSPKSGSYNQYEVEQFHYALNFYGGTYDTYVQSKWADDSKTTRKPDTVEFRFQQNTAVTQSVLVESEEKWAITAEQSASSNYGYLKFVLTGSQGDMSGSTQKVPLWNGEFWSAYLARSVMDSAANIDQEYKLKVKQFDASSGRIIHAGSGSLVISGAANVASRSYNTAFNAATDVFIGSKPTSSFGGPFTGSMQEFRFWANELDEGAFDNHVGSPRAMDGNSSTASFDDLILRYSFDDQINHFLTSSILDRSMDQTSILPGTASNYPNADVYSDFNETYLSNQPNVGGNRPRSNKIRLEDTQLYYGTLSSKKRSEISAYDLAPTDSPKLGVYLSPVDIMNEDIAHQLGVADLAEFYGEPGNMYQDEYEGLRIIRNRYFQKYSKPNNFWDFMRLVLFFDTSLFRQIRTLLPARARANVGLLIEEHMLARPKKKWTKPVSETRNWRKTIDLTEVFNTSASQDNYRTTLPFLSQSYIMTGTSSAYEGVMIDSASGVLFGTHDFLSGTLVDSASGVLFGTHDSLSGTLIDSASGVLTGTHDSLNGTISGSLGGIVNDFGGVGSAGQWNNTFYRSDKSRLPRQELKFSGATNKEELFDNFFGDIDTLFAQRIVTSSRASEVYSVKEYFYSSAVSKSNHEAGGLDYYILSSSLNPAEYQDFRGGGLTLGAFGAEKWQIDNGKNVGKVGNHIGSTIDGKEAVEIFETNPNRLVVRSTSDSNIDVE